MKIRFLGVYETYSNLYGHVFSKEILKDLISHLPLGGILNILSQFNAIPEHDKQIKEHFIKTLESTYAKPLTTDIKSDVIYSRQSLLNVWKWLLAFGDPDKLDQQVDIQWGICSILFTNLIVSDYLYESNNKG